MEDFSSVLKKEKIKRIDISREERIRRIKNFFDVTKKYAESFSRVTVAESGALFTEQEALAGGATDYRNVAEKKDFVEKMDKGYHLEKDLAEKFIQEINKIDENLPENEIEQAIQTEISRMELLLASRNIVSGKSDSKTVISGERVKNILEKQKVLEENSFKPEIKKVLKEMLSTSLMID